MDCGSAMKMNTIIGGEITIIIGMDIIMAVMAVIEVEENGITEGTAAAVMEGMEGMAAVIGNHKNSKHEGQYA